MSKRYPFNGYETMASGYTNGLYLPSKPLDEWNIDECRRALCRQANGDVTHCLECENKCRYGRRIEVLLAPVEQVVDRADEKAMDSERKRVDAMVAARKRKSKIKFMQMIASGNPKAFLEAHGMEVRNNLARVKKTYADVTAEEARKCLAEMGVEVEGVLGALVEQPVQEQATIAAEVEKVFYKLPAPKTEPVKPEPVEPAGVKLKINTLSGEWFSYKRTVANGGIGIELNTACIATSDDVDALCAEIKAAFAMMA